MITPNQVSLEKGIRGEFLQIVMGEQTLVPRLATVIPSTARTEKYAWLGDAPQLKDVTNDPIEVTPLSETSYSLENYTYASVIGIHRNDLADDQVGAFLLRARQQFTQAMRHANKLLIAALTANGTCYDGAAFFSDSHTARGQQTSAQDNLLAGTGVTVSALKTDLIAAIAAMWGFKDEANEPFHSESAQPSFAIVCPPSLGMPFREVVNASIISNTSNVSFEGMRFDIIPSARLTATDANDWYLMRTDQPLRGLILQDREPLTLEVLERDQQTSFFNEQFFYKVRRRYRVGYGPWQNAIKTVNS